MRIVALSFLILSFFSLNPNISFGFLDDIGEMDMYKKIDKGMYDLDLQYIEREVKWWDVNGSIKEQLTKMDDFYNYRNCFDIEFTNEEIEKIARDEQANAILMKKIETCSNDGSISVQTFAEYQKLIADYYQNNIVRAKSKSENIQKIARIGIYSDGIEENSPFDILWDIANINDIIFEKELTYEWYNNFDIGNYLDDDLSGTKLGALGQYGYYSQNQNLPIVWGKTQYGATWPLPFDPKSVEICHVNDSWLSSDAFNALTGNSGTTSNASWNGNNQNNSTSENLPNSSWQEYLSYVGNYSPLNDNALWPCNEFFCITVDMIMYRQNLLKWGTTLAIESLIKRSNEHIGKFTNTALIPATMTTNNFELGFQNLNLPDLFHVGIQITTKPVPFLNLDKNDSNKGRDESEYASKNLLSKYYENLGLDYQRANDLSLYNGQENMLKSMLSSAELTALSASQAQTELGVYQQYMALENDFLNETIDKKVFWDDMQEFQMQFTELQKFTQSMMEYSKNLQALAKKVSEIPKN